MIAVSSPSIDKDVMIKATIRQLQADGSKTFTVKAIRKQLKKSGFDVTPQAINQSLRAQPGMNQYGNIPKYWKLEGDL